MAKKFQVFIDALQKEYFQKLLLTGLKNTILIAVLGLLIGIVLGTIIAIIIMLIHRKAFSHNI